MQLRLQPKIDKNLPIYKLVGKAVLFVAIFFLAIFLLDKIEVSVPSKLTKYKISNEKIITLK